MDAVTSREFAATLDALDARWDARFSKFESSINTHVEAVEQAVARSIASSDQASETARSESRTTRWTLIGTGVAVVLGVAAFNATLLSNMTASFESGRSVATTVSEAKQQAEALSKDIQALRQQLNPVKPTGPGTSSTEPIAPADTIANVDRRRK